jgi:chlorite dismutase
MLVTFQGRDDGEWAIESVTLLAGQNLPTAPRLAVIEKAVPDPKPVSWQLRGTVSNLRYTTRRERSALQAVQAPLTRREATSAALIPIRKSNEWWQLAQDERREIMEEQSRHIAIGMEYLPAIARRLHHCRDLGEPFDFLTWFEFAPEHTGQFNDMLLRLRQSPEWRYVDREIDIRVSRIAADRAG